MRLSTLLRSSAVFALTATTAFAQTDKTGGPAGAPAAATLAAPANDNFADATVITAAGQYLSSTIDATTETGEPTIPTSCGSDDSGQSVWFRFQSVDGTAVTLDLDGSAVAPPGADGQFTDTILSVYTGSTLATLATVACNDDDASNTAAGDFTSLVTFTPTSGTAYYVRVTSYGGAGISLRYNGEVRLSVTGNVAAPTAAEVGADAFGSRLSVGPNPMAAAGRISLTSGQAQDVRVTLVDALGREVRVLAVRAIASGQTADIPVSTAGLPAGIYVVRAAGARLNLTQRVTVVR